VVWVQARSYPRFEDFAKNICIRTSIFCNEMISVTEQRAGLSYANFDFVFLQILQILFDHLPLPIAVASTINQIPQSLIRQYEEILNGFKLNCSKL